MSVSWREEPVTVSEATTRANLRQWSALARRDEPEDYALPFHEAEEPCTAAAAYVAAQARGDEYAAYCAMRAEEQAADRRVPCDGCKAVWDLDECVVTADEEIICPDCLAAPYATEGVEL